LNQFKNHALMGLISERFYIRYRPLKTSVNTRSTKNTFQITGKTETYGIRLGANFIHQCVKF